MVVLPAVMSPKVCVLLYWERFVSRPAVAVVLPPTLAATWDVNWPVLANCTVPMTPAVPLLLIDAVIPGPRQAVVQLGDHLSAADSAGAAADRYAARLCGAAGVRVVEVIGLRAGYQK